MEEWEGRIQPRYKAVNPEPQGFNNELSSMHITVRVVLKWWFVGLGISEELWNSL